MASWQRCLPEPAELEGGFVFYRLIAKYEPHGLSYQMGEDVASKGVAVVVPAVTDLNRGDQALAWEAARLIEEFGVAGEVLFLDAGEDANERELQTAQTRARGYQVLRRILPHPRRGRYSAGDRVREGRVSVILMVVHSLRDLFWGTALLFFARFPRIVRLMLREAERWRTYEAFRNAEVVVVKGGGFLHAYGSIRDVYYIWYQLFYFRLARRLNKPVVVLPNSFGPFRGISVKVQIKSALSRCAFISARESVSAEVLQKVIERKVPVFPDMGYFLDESAADKGQEVLCRFGVPLGYQKYVGFTVRPYRFPGSRNPLLAYSKYLDAVANLINYVASKGFFSVLVTQVAGPSAHEDDRLAVRDLLLKAGDVPCVWIDFRGDCRELKGIYGGFDYMVGTRFHSVIFAQGVGVPSLAIAYGGNKAAGIMRDMGLGDYVIPIEHVTGKALCRKFDRLMEREEYVREKLRFWRGYALIARREMGESIRASLKRPGA